MNAESVQIGQEEEKRAKEWPCELPFNISDNTTLSSKPLIVNLLDFVGEVKFAACGQVCGCSGTTTRNP
jgi:hypothetical protein